MMPIQDLLHRIQWDRDFARGDFQLGYYDRVDDRIILVPMARVHFPQGEHFSLEVIDDQGAVHTVPLHRVKAVYRDGNRIWHRD